MNRRATAEAPANIAFIKYWGAHDLERGVPLNASISMTLDRCVSTCTVETRPADSGEPGAADEVFLTSSVRGIMPVTTLDGSKVGGGTAGPLTRRLHVAYTEYVANAAG